MAHVRHLALFAALTLSGCAQARSPATSAPFTLEREITLPGVSGRIDHLAADPAHHRVFVAEIANGSVDVVDLASGRRQRIEGLSEPQGVAYLPALDQLVVASGGDGTLRFYAASSLALIGSIKLGRDADNVRVDPASGQVAVGYGGGAIALIDHAKREVIRRIALPVHPEGFQIDRRKARLYVNLPNARAVAVADLASGAVIARWVAPHRLNFPMALGVGGDTVAIVSRLPAHVSWLDATSGTVRRDMPVCGDADDLFRDARRRRWYVSCGSGKVETFAENGSAMASLGTMPTGSGARTSVFSPELDRLIVAVPAAWLGGHAKLLILKPKD